MERQIGTIEFYTMVFQLNEEMVFPDPMLANESGLLAIGGDLKPERLILAYSSGIFPWYNEDEPVCWYAPNPRCVLFPDEIKISKSLRKTIRSNVFRVSFNTNFESVIEQCKSVHRPGQDGTWITPDMKQAYIQLHKAGLAKSIEVWQNDKLVGGLYGVQVNNVFCGESMFSLVSNASKIALAWLCHHTAYSIIDCQVANPHLLSMGAKEIPLIHYLERLQQS